MSPIVNAIKCKRRQQGVLCAGTLTQNEMTVVRAWIGGREFYELQNLGQNLGSNSGSADGGCNGGKLPLII